jgi:hypothetical protein
MNAIETAENIVACRMTSIDEVLTMAVKPESLEAVKQLIRIQLDIAIGEAMTAVGVPPLMFRYTAIQLTSEVRAAIEAAGIEI